MIQPPEGDRSMSNLFWLSEAQIARLQPFFP
ncbi:IS5/IS1182 family transposase, partial [Rhodobacteraceae bacterium KMS-5]|nr:IS5/IS1182 family transposase [Tabrizicola oligotrophica]